MGISVPGDLADDRRYSGIQNRVSAGSLVIDRLARGKGMSSVVDEGYDIIVRRSA